MTDKDKITLAHKILIGAYNDGACDDASYLWGTLAAALVALEQEEESQQ